TPSPFSRLLAGPPRMSCVNSRAAALAALLVIAVACGKSAPPSAQSFALPPTPVGVVTVAPARVAEAYEFAGQVQPFRRVEVRSRVDGIVVDRPFTEGSVVEKGQVLYRLDTVRYEAAYRTTLAR